ncbi:MAG: hypothetical protein O7D29_10605 [Gemmatimonadetes bacterium]|nr:hypothetical protein [Gemmatimonadota bacterium]
MWEIVEMTLFRAFPFIKIFKFEIYPNVSDLEKLVLDRGRLILTYQALLLVHIYRVRVFAFGCLRFHDQMTPAQIAEAKRLAAEWKPGDCGAEDRTAESTK